MPWGIAAAILAYLFGRVPAGEAWQAASSARLDLFLPAMVAACALWFLIDSSAFAFLFTRFNAPVSWAEARSLRATTYLATPINWNLGTAAVVLHLRRSKSIAALDSTSTMLFYQAIDGMVLAACVLIGAWLLPHSPEVASLRTTAAGFEVVLGSTLVLAMTSTPAWGWLERVRNAGILRSHRMARLGDVVGLAALKAMYFSVFVGIFWLGCRSFGVMIPLQIALAATPAILIVAVLPITPGGLGTQQAAMMYFFSPYGDEASILAFGLTFPVALILSRCLLGLLYVRDLGKLRKSEAPS